MLDAMVSVLTSTSSLVYLDVALNQDQYEREDGSKGSVVSLVQSMSYITNCCLDVPLTHSIARIDLLSSPRAVQEEDDE